MLTIRKKLAEQASSGRGTRGQQKHTPSGRAPKRKLSFRSQILSGACVAHNATSDEEELVVEDLGTRLQQIRKASELGEITPKTCSVHFDDPDDFRRFRVTIKPDEGYWKGGTFTFKVTVPEEYNIKPPHVVCRTRLWHPNINETGEVCLSILRETSIDGTGWSPARRLKDVVLGLNSLFTDLVSFDDPLNLEAAEHYQRDKVSFARKVQQFVRLYASSQPL